MTLLTRVLLLAGTLLLMTTVAAAGKAPPAANVRYTTGGVLTLAMDGPRVAYATEAGNVSVWNVRTGMATLVSKRNPDFVKEVAIAGTRVAWIARDVTAPDPNSEVAEALSVRSLTSPAITRPLASAFRSEHTQYDADAVYSYVGDWIGGLVGSKKLLMVGRWATTGPGTLTQAELDSIGGPAGLQRRVSGAGSIVSQSTDGARVAVLRSTDAWPVAGELRGKTASASVGIYSSAGRLLREIDAVTAREVALSGTNLVVLTKTDALVVYNWRNGRLVHRWHVPSVGTNHLEDVYGNTAAYSVYSHGRNLHLLQLNTGKDVLLTKGWASPHRRRP